MKAGIDPVKSFEVVGLLRFEQEGDTGWWVIDVETPPLNTSGTPEPIPCENLWVGMHDRRVKIVIEDLGEKDEQRSISVR